MLTSRSLSICLINVFAISFLANALPQEVVTSVAVVTVFDDGQGAGQGAAMSTVVASDGVDPGANDIILPFVPSDGGLVQAATVAAEASMITAAPDAKGAGDPSCNQCSIYFQYVSVYYWPTPNSNNTACLSGVTAEVNGPVPTDLTPASPSNYLVFPTISAGNACTQVGNVYYDHTMSFAPGGISSIVGNPPQTQEFNFADLPCPPPDVASADSYFYNPSWNPGRPYSPMVAPPQEIFELDPAFASCVVAVYQGFDPSGVLGHYYGHFGPGGGLRRKRSAPAHNVPRGPAQTAAPWH